MVVAGPSRRRGRRRGHASGNHCLRGALKPRPCCACCSCQRMGGVVTSKPATNCMSRGASTGRGRGGGLHLGRCCLPRVLASSNSRDERTWSSVHPKRGAGVREGVLASTRLEREINRWSVLAEAAPGFHFVRTKHRSLDCIDCSNRSRELNVHDARCTMHDARRFSNSLARVHVLSIPGIQLAGGRHVFDTGLTALPSPKTKDCRASRQGRAHRSIAKSPTALGRAH